MKARIVWTRSLDNQLLAGFTMAGWRVIDCVGNDYDFFPVRGRGIRGDFWQERAKAEKTCDALNAGGARRERALRRAAE